MKWGSSDKTSHWRLFPDLISLKHSETVLKPLSVDLDSAHIANFTLFAQTSAPWEAKNWNIMVAQAIWKLWKANKKNSDDPINK